MEHRIVLHHVGARGKGLGRLQAPLLRAFPDDVLVVLYEADESCIEATRQWWRANSKCSPTIHPYCLWADDGEIEFFVNRRGATSSVYPLNERFSGHYRPARQGRDYVLGSAAATVETRRLPTRSLDSLVESGEVAAPDFLGLDTQGSEFEILAGGMETIRRSTVAILTEVAFDEVYNGQKIFSDVHALLLDAGFVLAKLRTQSYSSFQGPAGTRAKAEPLFGDAMYFRRPETLPAGDRTAALYKLAAIAAALMHLEYALRALAAANAETDEAAARALSRYRYVRVLRAIGAAAAAAPDGVGAAPVERVLREHGLDDVAGEVEKHRLGRS